MGIAEAPLFSIVIPLYRCEDYVAECVASLTRQTCGDFEALLVDDGSPDESLARARSVASDDERFRFFALPENNGPSTARNRALDEARGSIVVFLDSDDALADDALERIAQRMKGQQLDILHFNAKPFYGNDSAKGLQLEDFSGRPDFEDVATGRAFFAFCEQHRAFYPNAALQAFNRTFIEEAGLRFREGIIHEDLLFTVQAMVAAERVSFLNEALYLRRVRADSIMTAAKKTSRNVAGHVESIRFLNGWVTDHADSLDGDFLAAAAHRIDAWCDLCADYWANHLDESDKRAYLASLSPAERFEVEKDVVQRASLLGDIYGSLSWRIGRAATALPRYVVDKASLLRQTR